MDFDGWWQLTRREFLGFGLAAGAGLAKKAGLEGSSPTF